MSETKKEKKATLMKGKIDHKGETDNEEILVL
jgi:hypothetical protein